MSTQSERQVLLEQALREGQLALERSNLEQARMQFQAALRIDKDNEAALTGLRNVATQEKALADKTAYQELMAAGKTARDNRNLAQAVSEYERARDAALRMSVMEQQEASIQYHLAQGEKSLQEVDYVRASEFFRQALELDAKQPEARAGLVATYLGQGQRKEQRRQLGSAAAIYEELLRFDPGNSEGKARLRAVQVRTWRTRGLISVVLLAVLLLALAQINRMIAWPVAACEVTTLGEVLCTPTPTSTYTPTATATATNTATPTPTPTSTFTPTPTLTPTSTATPTATPTFTPTPMVVQPRYNQTGVYPDPFSTRIIGVLYLEDQIYLCARTTERFLVAKNHCHLTEPLGWVNVDNVVPSFKERFPESLVTPLPTWTPQPAATATVSATTQS